MLNCFSLINAKEVFVGFFLKGLSTLFLNAMIIALPVVGTLFLINVAMGFAFQAPTRSSFRGFRLRFS